MVSTSFMQFFCFISVLTLAMAGAAYLCRRNFWNGSGGALLELGIWTCSLLASISAEYMLVMLNDTRTWGAA